jgi:glutathione S-transferase
MRETKSDRLLGRDPPMLYSLAVTPSARFSMKLIASLTSPYARKVRIALAEKRIEYSLEEAAPWAPDSAVAQWNPLGKVPVLVLDDGTPLYDSRVIVEYLDSVSPVSRLIPEPTRQRIAVRKWEALGDGICDAAALALLETRRPAREQSADWIARQRQKIELGVAELSRELGDRPWCAGDGYTLADIATGCALAYLDFRHPDIDWRDRYANLGRHAEKLAKRPSFAESAPPAG